MARSTVPERAMCASAGARLSRQPSSISAAIMARLTAPERCQVEPTAFIYFCGYYGSQHCS
ncbi:hypothetical protein RvY_03140 [Ramazzottius varieornatus]|uniref:Uncharacterized protein n=1 Tax=Ramazzottius varieornatus TaxID=947166 RepID=A0A1D1UM13_RAMVA|nr:hypothetical protein RvY_03140 [Ramazzottius varieornatus]